MNLKLNVVRFNNEDVIATSCDHTKDHYYFRGNESDGEFYGAYVSKFGDNNFLTDLKQDKTINSLPEGTKYAKEEWVKEEDYIGKFLNVYIYENGKYIECNGEHLYFVK